MNLIKLKNYNTQDTIAAIATFPSKSALGIIRISGKKSLSILSNIFIPGKKKDIKKAKTHTLHYGWIIDRPQSAKRSEAPRSLPVREFPKGTKGQRLQAYRKGVVDEVLVSIMKKPHSYTCEDVVEISCHGGCLVLDKILKILLKNGTRLALPGEFTYRAFLNGRINLLQAESVKNIIEAKSDKALTAAISQLGQNSLAKLSELKEELRKIFLYTEASINFPEDDINLDLKIVKDALKRISKNIQGIIETNSRSKVIKDGLKCVICGKTNVGKSTLFNCLLGKERVIVNKTPGTTRDIIEEIINIKGVPLRIFDTAGILTPRDLIEKKAIENSSKIFDEADLVVLVLDGSRKLDDEDLFLLRKIKKRFIKDDNALSDINRGALIVINKSDLKRKINLKKITGIKCPMVKLSALKKEGINNLEKAVADISYKNGIKKEDILFLNAYQDKLLRDAQKDIEQARELFSKGQKIDFINSALKNALENLGKISGEIYCEELLESIFSQFCIGK